MGLNINKQFSNKLRFNSFNYYIADGYDYTSEIFTYEGSSLSSRRRFFTINNLNYYAVKGVWSINNGIDMSKKQYSFGNIDSKNNANSVYASINYRLSDIAPVSFQTGISYDYQSNTFNDSIPSFFLHYHQNHLL